MKPPAVLKGPLTPLWARSQDVRASRHASFIDKAWLTGEISDLVADRGRRLRTGDWSQAHPGPFIDVARRLLSALNDLRAAYCIIGGLAAGLYGLERSTKDVDMIVQLDPPAVADVLAALRQAGFRISRLGAGDIRESGLVVRTAGTRVWGDIFWSGTLADPEVLAHRRRVTLFGVPTWICGPEDLILLKLKAGRGQDEEDIRGILAVRAGSLDRRRLLSEAGVLGRRRRLVALAREAGLRWR